MRLITTASVDSLHHVLYIEDYQIGLDMIPQTILPIVVITAAEESDYFSQLMLKIQQPKFINYKFKTFPLQLYHLMVGHTLLS